MYSKIRKLATYFLVTVTTGKLLVIHFSTSFFNKLAVRSLGPVVQRVDNAIHPLNNRALVTI